MLASTRSDNDLTIWLDPERDRLVAELSAINEELAAAEVELADLTVRVRAFAAFHDRTMAPLYAELDDVNAEIAELLAERSGSPEDLADAARARELANQSAKAAQAIADGPGAGTRKASDVVVSPEPSEESRKLFRSLIKQCHPDLADDDTDREHRESFTRLVNDAYASNDTDRLAQLADQWHDQAPGAGAGQRPERPIADIATSIGVTRARLAEVRAETTTLASSSFGRLVLERPDPLAAVRSIASRVEGQINRQREVLAGLALL